MRDFDLNESLTVDWTVCCSIAPILMKVGHQDEDRKGRTSWRWAWVSYNAGAAL